MISMVARMMIYMMTLMHGRVIFRRWLMALMIHTSVIIMAGMTSVIAMTAMVAMVVMIAVIAMTAVTNIVISVQNSHHLIRDTLRT